MREANPLLQRLRRKNVLAGLMFIAIAAFGLWLSREYPMGTLRRMGTGFMPQALCWLLMVLGSIVLVQGLLQRADDTASSGGGSELTRTEERENYWSILFVAASLVAFALTIERLGLVVAIALLILIASFAYRGLRWWETVATGLVLAVLCWAVFVLGLGMTVKVLPEL
jgi:hypothetical protein